MDLKDIKSKITLSTVISKYIKLMKKNNLYWGKCIFHKENTPSFAVNDEKEFFHCFGCGAHGDVFSFLIEISKKSFNEILEELCLTYNIPYKKNTIKPPNNKLKDILAKALKIYKQFLQEDLNIKNILLNRGISDILIEKFQIGYAKQNGVVVKLLQEYSLHDLKEAGIVSMGSFDRLRNRIIFPIFNEQNIPIAFAGRTILDEKPKYINSSETDLFQKNLCLYNINNIPLQAPEIFLVEGYIDVITMDQYGFPNTLAAMGTSVSKSQLFMLLKRTKKLYLLFDGDEGGHKAAERTMNLLLEMLIPGYSIQIGMLPPGEDPDSFLRHHPSSTLKNYCKDIIEILIANITNGLNLDLAEGLSSAFNNMYTYVGLIKNESVRASYKLILEKKLRQANYKSKPKIQNNNYNNKKTIPSNASVISGIYIPTIEEHIISIIIQHSDLLENFVENLAIIAFKDMELEKIKNNLVLHINDNEFNHIIQEYKNNPRIQKLINYNSSLLSKKEFCKKYLWDLLCLMPLDLYKPQL